MTDNNKHTKGTSGVLPGPLMKNISSKEEDERGEDKNEDVPTEYTEKTWGKNEGGEFIIDGFTFTGKRIFKKAKEGLAEVMKKGAQSEIHGMQYKALDTRNKGTALEIDVEMTHKGVSGVAVLKLYGPNKSKEYVVMISKSKRSDHKFVTILANEIIKPLMKKFLSPDYVKTETLPKKASVQAEVKTSFDCPICEKSFNSLSGLRCHDTKMHKTEKALAKDGNKNKAKEIVDSNDALLADSTEDEEENLDEKCNNIKQGQKKFTDKCDLCDFKVETNRKYELIQIMLRHKEICCSPKPTKVLKQKTCTVCDFVGKDEMNLKRHKRDEHSILTVSTSPPLKKKKVTSNQGFDKIEEMDIDISEEDIKDLSFKLEDMDFGTEEHEHIDRTDMMDEKIKAKQRKIEEEEREFQKRIQSKEMKKKKQEDIELERIKKLNKQRKQELKDKKKKRRKKNSLRNSNDLQHSKIPNIRPVPRNCAHLVKKDDLVYTVPGDGSCGPNSATAFLFEDEVFGPKLRKRMNKHMAKHWNLRYQYITECSEDQPFVRKLGEGEVKYTDPLLLTKYLSSSEEAAFMWTDSEDLAVICDLYQVNIKVITTKGENDENPTVNHIAPDEGMKEFSELKGVKFEEMVLLHQEDCHFDLIVSKNSNLATVGSLSYRSNIGPLIDQNECDEESAIDEEKPEVEEDHKKIEPETDKIISLQRELKREKDSKKALELEYSKCEQELNRKTEEVEKLKTELKDIKLIAQLEEEIVENVKIDHETLKETRKGKDKVVEKGKTQRRQYNCTEPQFNCTQCFFQGSNSEELEKHINIKHTTQGGMTCRNCGKMFETKPNLMDHRKTEHLASVAPCRNNMEGLCSYSNRMCWWSHEAQNESKEPSGGNIKCYICSKMFGNKGAMMTHRKKEHSNVVRVCNMFLSNECRYNNSACWYSHEEDNKAKNNEEEASQSVFQKVQENLEPPLKSQEKNQNQENQS